MVEEFDLPAEIIDRKVTKMKMISPSNREVDVGRTLSDAEYIGMCRREVMDAFLRERAVKEGAQLINGLMMRMEQPGECCVCWRVFVCVCVWVDVRVGVLACVCVCVCVLLCVGACACALLPLLKKNSARTNTQTLNTLPLRPTHQNPTPKNPPKHKQTAATARLRSTTTTTTRAARSACPRASTSTS